MLTTAATCLLKHLQVADTNAAALLEELTCALVGIVMGTGLNPVPSKGIGGMTGPPDSSRAVTKICDKCLMANLIAVFLSLMGTGVLTAYCPPELTHWTSKHCQPLYLPMYNELDCMDAVLANFVQIMAGGLFQHILVGTSQSIRLMQSSQRQAPGSCRSCNLLSHAVHVFRQCLPVVSMGFSSSILDAWTLAIGWADRQ